MARRLPEGKREARPLPAPPGVVANIARAARGRGRALEFREKLSMLAKLAAIRRSAQKEGWSAALAHRLIAQVEEDGRATPAERKAIAALLAEDHYERPARPLDPAARRELSRYLAFAESLGPRPARGARGGRGEARPGLGGTRGLASAGRSERRLADELGPAEAHRPLLQRLGLDVDPARYEDNVRRACGERPVRLPGGARVRFRDRYLPSPGHQLEEVARWLADYHARLGLEVELQPVEWEGRRLHNVIATLPGRSRRAVALADHYDVADKEHLCPGAERQLTRDHGWSRAAVAAHKDRIALGQAVVGADDNASATAALLEAAHVLAAARARGCTLERSVRLVHLVGEELPADCLGGRRYVERTVKRGEALEAVLVLDMIGVDRTGARKVQLSPGAPEASLGIAAAVKRAIEGLELDLVPVLRPYGARKSFLHQTDGIHFSDAGIPVVLLNEHLNDDRDRFRAGYHDEFDVPELMDFGFAADVCRAAVETALALAGVA